MPKLPSTQAKKIRIHCNECNGSTWHDVESEYELEWREQLDELEFANGANSYQIAKCRGCDNVHFRHESWFSEDTDENFNPTIHVKTYPQRVSRPMPAWLSDEERSPFTLAEPHLNSLLQETYSALHADLLTLAAMGVRALLEQVMIKNIADRGTFRGNLEALNEAGMILPYQKDQLIDVIEIGHGAMHRGFKPNARELNTVFDIVENLLATIYVHPQRARNLAERVPPRPRRR